MGYLEGKVLYGGISRCEFCGFSAQRSIGFGRIQKKYGGMVRRIHTNWVIFTPSGMQETPYSEEIRYDGEKSCTDEELYDMIRYAQSLGLKVALKPTVNCDNGVWRARISFLTMMYLANPNGATGSRVTLPFRNIMHRLRSGQAVNCSWRGAK